MSRRKSLAEELADLANPAPTKEIDPDADPFGAGPALAESDDDLAAAALSTGKGREKARLRGDIVLEGAAYAGRRSSRAAMFDNQASDDEEAAAAGSDDEDDEEEPSGGSSSEEGEEAADGSSDDEQLDGISAGAESESEVEAGAGDSDDEAPEVQANGRPPRGGGNEREDEHGPSGSEDESNEEGSGGGAVAVAAAAAGGEMAALEAEYAALQAADAEAAAGLRERAARERRKALAVRAQRGLWQRGLELRILLQRALGGANRLPRPAGHAAVAAASPELAQALADLAADAAETVETLAGLLDALVGQNPALAEATAAAGAPAAAAAGDKRRREEQGDEEEEREGRGGKAARLWARLDAGHAGLVPFRDASIDRWHRKTVLTTGGAARGGGLRVLNQSVSAQVAALMRDPARLIARTRLLRGASRALCEPAEPVADHDEQQAADHFDGTGEPVPASQQHEDRDPETFDDTEFYQTLLKEFLEGSADGGGGNWYSGTKQRKQVDRRASKGRKLRYHVHEKLVNFMTPVELQAPEFAPNLLSGLFGGAGNA